MKRVLGYILLVLLGLVLGAGGAGYFFYYKGGQLPAIGVSLAAKIGESSRAPASRAEEGLSTSAPKKERKVLFWRHPMNPKVSSPTPQKDEMGMDYIPVYEEENGAEKAAGTAKTPPEKNQKKERKVLLYRHPMNPQVTSPTPQKDEMGMDYIPVYEEEAGADEAPGTIRISPEKIQKIGVKSELVKVRTLKRTIRTVGRVNFDESRVFNINTKVGGWVEKLYINRTDLVVKAGEKLLELYSPDLVSAQEEYLLAFRALDRVKESPYQDVKKGAESLLRAAVQRLKYWDITEAQIKILEEEGKITRTMTVYFWGQGIDQGIVTEKMVNEGTRIEPGMMLFKIIDHSKVWVYGEVYEYELPFIKIGQKARISPSYSPGSVYTATINHIYTHFGTVRFETDNKMEESRTAKIRFELPNPVYKLKLDAYVNVELDVDVAANAVTVPDSSVIDTGIRHVLIVDRGNGKFEPRDVKVGSQAGGYYQIVSGVKAGEKVVTSANFLIDSESSFRAALSGMKEHGQ